MRRYTAVRLWALFCLLTLVPSVVGRADTSPETIRRGKKATALVQSNEAEGTAFCIAASGLFVTNQHVVEGADKSKLKLILNAGEANQRIMQATVVREDKEADIALLQAFETEGFTLLPLGDAEDLIETQSVVAFGYPFGSELAIGKEKYPNISVNVGRITALRREAGRLRQIQLDAALNPGNSGGPIVNEKGDVVGIVQSGVPGAGVNFAIPITRLRAFLRKAQAILRPPLFTPDTERMEQEWGIDVLATAKPGAVVSVTLALTAPGQETREFTAKSLGGNRYSVRAAPIPVPVNVLTVRVLVRDGSSEGDYIVKNRTVSVGDHACKLSEIKRIVRGPSGYALMANGQKLRGSVSGLTALETVGNGSIHINLLESQDIRIQPVAPEGQGLTYRILVREDGQIICDNAGTLAAGTSEAGMMPADTSAPSEAASPEPGRAGNGMPAPPAVGHTGLLVVAADEWPTSDTGYAQAPGSAERFVQNLGRLFAGRGGGKFLIYSTHWTYGRPFQDTLRQMGYQLTVSMTPNALSDYNGVFVGGTPGVSRAALLTYLQHGGNVYIAGSTGMDQERPFWNALLGQYGMEYITHPKDGPIAEPLQIHTFAPCPLFQSVRELHLRGPNPIRVTPGYEKQVQVLSQEDGYNWWALVAVPRVARRAAASATPPAEAAQGGRRVYNEANAHWYEMVSREGGYTWAEAFADAQTRIHRGLRGHLVTLTSTQESLFVMECLPQAVSGQYWLGGYKDQNVRDNAHPDQGWRWVTGEPWQYTDWHGGSIPQPDNMGGHEDCLQYAGGGTWNDVAANIRVPGYVVEFEPASRR